MCQMGHEQTVDAIQFLYTIQFNGALLAWTTDIYIAKASVKFSFSFKENWLIAAQQQFTENNIAT